MTTSLRNESIFILLICEWLLQVVKHPWQRVSLRSIEPLSYSIVDLSHNMQGGKTDKIHNKAAVMDTIPYSRVSWYQFVLYLNFFIISAHNIVGALHTPFGAGILSCVSG